MADTPAAGTAAPDDFDHVFAMLGNGTDTVAGAAAGAGSGTDTVEGAAGTDTVAGALPDPSAVDGGGTDTITGGGTDTIEGGAGTDTITGGGTDTVAGGEKPAAAGASAEDFLRDFRALVAKEAGEKPAPQSQPQPEQQPEVTPFTAEDLELIKQVETEYPDVMRVFEAKSIRMAQATTAHIFKQIAPILEALGTTAQTITTKTHLDTLQAKVPDYNEIVPKVQAWIDQQPAYLKATYQAVAKSGTVNDVVDMIDRFRAATNTPKPGATPPAAGGAKPAAGAAAAAKPAAGKKDVAGLAPVGSKRTGVQADAVANDDFDSAFAQAERELGSVG